MQQLDHPNIVKLKHVRGHLSCSFMIFLISVCAGIQDKR